MDKEFNYRQEDWKKICAVIEKSTNGDELETYCKNLKTKKVTNIKETLHFNFLCKKIIGFSSKYNKNLELNLPIINLSNSNELNVFSIIDEALLNDKVLSFLSRYIDVIKNTEIVDIKKIELIIKHFPEHHENIINLVHKCSDAIKLYSNLYHAPKTKLENLVLLEYIKKNANFLKDNNSVKYNEYEHLFNNILNKKQKPNNTSFGLIFIGLGGILYYFTNRSENITDATLWV